MTESTAPVLELSTRWSTCRVSLFGAQVLSFVPMGTRDLLWMTDRPKPAPAPIRGGVPLCWPWFGRQGAPDGAPQHGHARTARWKVDTMRALPGGERTLRLLPEAPIHALTPVLDLTVGERLTMRLTTVNETDAPQTLTQAFHSYFAVADAARAVVHGLEGRRYRDNRDGGAETTQDGAFAGPVACERLYHGFDADPRLSIDDPAGARRIAIETGGSRSVMVWNPGADLARGFADMGPDAWRAFVCVEVANCGPDDWVLQPGGMHELMQMIGLDPAAARRGDPGR